MKTFKNKVAVITGGASGLGREIARRATGEGMKVVLADIQQDALESTAAELRAGGAEVLTVKANVAKGEDIEALAKKTLERYGSVHLLFNNAGVAHNRTTWEATTQDWEWVLGVNLWGVIHGVRVFTPIMIGQDTECHIVNTASVAGLLSPPGMATYNVSKHAVVTLSETLHYDLQRRHTKVKVSVLCPAWVSTNIWDAERNRPSELKDAGGPAADDDLAMQQAARKAIQSGKVSPEQVAEIVFAAIEQDKFYILTHPKIKRWIQLRMQDILEERNPSPQA
jgi:NAD(P)-dependent dehydrogenase (short-subunit alcohol dehydrogenase family)